MQEITSVQQVAAVDTSKELRLAAIAHNWDDGLDIPLAIAEHPRCDLAVALELFWLAEAIGWYTHDVPSDDFNQEWVAFCALVTGRILAGHYQRGSASFKSPLGAAQLHKYRNRGVPELLMNSIPAQHAQPAVAADGHASGHSADGQE